MLATMRLSAIEHSPRPRTVYTQLCFCYTVSDGRKQEQILRGLHQGLHRLTEAVPWVAGQVVEEEGSMSVAPLHDVPGLVVKDLTAEVSAPTMQQLRDANYPFSMLDERLICPRSTFSDGPNEDETHPYPVLLLQANFVQGGMLLTILTCHSVMDIVGQVQIIKLLSKACNGEPFTNEEMADCNIDRQNLIPPLDDNERQRTSAPPVTSVAAPPQTLAAPKLQWAYFQFSDSALHILKASVTSTLSGSTHFVSTDDCICALLWQSLARIRLVRLDGAKALNFLRQVDVRRYMKISATYPGNMVTPVTTSLSLAELTCDSLGTLASKMRALLEPKDLVYNLRAGAVVSNQPRQRRNTANGNRRFDREDAITMSSWTKADCKDVDFNLGLGIPVAVRRPMFTSIEGLVYLLPKGGDGEILAALCLRDEDMDGLRHDEEFCRWAQYIG